MRCPFFPEERELSLSKIGNPVGALVCRPEIFNVLYELERKRVKRREITSLLIKINLDQIVNSKKSKQMLQQLSRNLRAGDLLSATDKQIYVLIHDISTTDFLIIFKRIIYLIISNELELTFPLEWEEISVPSQSMISGFYFKL